MTLIAGEPDSVVIAKVVRVIAAVSGPARSSARVRAGFNRSALASRGRSGRVACGARRRNSSIVGAGRLAAMGERSRRVIARARRAVGPILAGVEAWPPRPSTRSSIDVAPFSVTPTTPIGARTPGKASLATAPPSSSTNHGRTPRWSSSATASRAAVPMTSSSQPNDSHTSCAGVKPSASSCSTASQIPTRQPLSSRVPRPQITCSPSCSTTSAPNASCCQVPSTGTTSRWAIRTAGRASAAPRQWRSRPWVEMRVRSRCSCRSGNSRSCSATKRSNAALSMRSGSRWLTVGIRTSVCSLLTAWGWALTRAR